MSFAKSKKSAADVKQSGGSNYINASGFYPVNIIAPLVSVSNGGSTSVDLYLDHAGQKQVIYGNLRVTNNNGDENAIGAKVFNQLLVIADVDDCADPVEATLPIGQREKEKDCSVLEDLADIDLIVRIQMEYGAWNGNITENKIIKGFYRADTATAEEIVNETDVGAGYENDKKYANNVTYNDGLTPEQVQDWINAKRPKGTADEGATEGGGATAKKTAPKFGKKRFGKKPE